MLARSAEDVYKIGMTRRLSLMTVCENWGML